MQNHMKEGKKLDSFFCSLGITEAIYIIKNWKLGNYGSDFFFFLNNGKWPQEEIKAKKVNKDSDCIFYVYIKNIQTYCWGKESEMSCLMGWACHWQGQGWVQIICPSRSSYAVRNKCLTGHSQMLIIVETGPACQWSDTML